MRKYILNLGAGNMQWFEWSRRIQAIAQTGLTYGEGPYDLERYQELRQVAIEIMAAHTSQSHEELTRIFDMEQGYPTPKVGVQGVVFDTQGQLLFVREAAQGLWSLPGGWADVGESPSEVAAREVLEESGYVVKPVKLLAVLHKAKHHPPALWDVYKLFFQCELIGGEAKCSLETDGVAFFPQHSLPPLSTSRITTGQIHRMFAHKQDPTLSTDFD
jgi:ADP-ribose pyrophosphatase YjhB (NUDIX family)